MLESPLMTRIAGSVDRFCSCWLLSPSHSEVLFLLPFRGPSSSFSLWIPPFLCFLPLLLALLVDCFVVFFCFWFCGLLVLVFPAAIWWYEFLHCCFGMPPVALSQLIGGASVMLGQQLSCPVHLRIVILLFLLNPRGGELLVPCSPPVPVFLVQSV